MDVELKVSSVFKENSKYLNDDKFRFIINQGGTRSSKTYSLCQLLIFYALQNENKVISIVRKSFPALRATVMRDFFGIMKELGIYNENSHSKSENIYTFQTGSQVEFFSIDDEQKIRGRKRDILWANESNELTFDEFNQLNFRTEYKLFFDFNPSSSHHWLYSLISRDEAIKIHSTYKDNPFLSKRLIKEIEELIEVDEDYYNIYALGLPSRSKDVVYSHQKFFKERPITKETILAIDFGYIDPTALLRIDVIDNEYYVTELLFQSYLTTDELIELLKELFITEDLSLNTLMVADYARPEIIAQMNRHGFNVHNAIKKIQQGIDAVKSVKLFINDYSENLKEELINYHWKKNKAGQLLDEPVDKFNHLLDAMRYGILYQKKLDDSSGGWDFMTISI
jgi:phage terminase large subunit